MFKGRFFEVFQKASFYPECLLGVQGNYCVVGFEVKREK